MDAGNILGHKRRLQSKKKTLVRWVKNVLSTICYYFERSRYQTRNIRKIIFVCQGNICRSVFAELMLRKLKKNTGVVIESCGLQTDQGTHSPREAVDAARFFGVGLETHVSKCCRDCDFGSADLILPMELWHYRELIARYPDKKRNTRLLREFAPFPLNLLSGIDDPYGGSPAEFRKCFRLIKKSVSNIRL
jgi:protein-tyrosine phosphatase